MHIVSALFIMLLGQLSFAQLSQNQFTGNVSTSHLDFVAPVLDSEADATRQAGYIFYDIGSGLKIVSPTGQIETLSITGQTAISSASGERIERATLNNGSSTSCTVLSESGDWLVNSGSRSGNGICSFTLSGNPFAGAPTCVCSVSGSTANQCYVNTTSTTIIVTSQYDVTNTDENGVKVICMGER